MSPLRIVGGLWLAVLLLPACGSSGAGAPDGAVCAQVCWRVVPRLANPEEGETETFTSDECRCPDGHACTGRQTVRTGVETRHGLGGYHDPAVGDENVLTGRGMATYPVCEPIDRQKTALVFDFRDDAPRVPVTLRFRRGGEPWPASPAPGSAGELTITLERPGAPVVQPLPTSAEGTMMVMLPRGRHRVRLQMGRGVGFDPTRYPISTLEGELVVAQAGEVLVDVPATAFTFEVRAGAAPFPVPKAGESVAVRIEGRYGLPGISSNLVVWRRSAGQPLERQTVWLEPGKYTVTVITEGALENPSFPGGYVIATRHLEIGAAPVERIFDLRIVRMEGNVTIDGKDLPPEAMAEVGLAARDAVARAVIGAARPARYGVLAFAGEYEHITLATQSGSEGVPAGGVRVLSKKRLDQDQAVPIDATTAAFAAEVTANGAALADAASDRGTLLLDGAISHELFLGSMGPALIAGRIFQGAPVTVKVVGRGRGALPPLAMTVATDFTPSSTPARFDLVVAPLTVGLQVDGQDPPANPAGRGIFRFTRADDPTARFRVPASTEGPLAATTSVPPGTWKVVFQNSGAAPGVPAGELALPDLVVPREGLVQRIPVTSVELALEVQRNGAPLPDATGAQDRGAVQIGVTRLRLPRTGPARLMVKAFPGITSVAVLCDESCGAGLPAFLTVAPRVRVGAPN